MNFKEILELIDKVADRGITAVEIDRAGTKVRIERTAHTQIAATTSRVTGGLEEAVHSAPATPPPTAAAIAAAASKAESDAEAGLHIITSPIVGTFYRSPNPESDVFVNVGDRVSKGKVLCIIEAMKLMNEIEADADGVIERIYPQSGQPIEYGEKLFAIKV